MIQLLRSSSSVRIVAAETVRSPNELTPEDTLLIREQVVERYLRKNHPRWIEGTPTPR